MFEPWTDSRSLPHGEPWLSSSVVAEVSSYTRVLFETLGEFIFKLYGVLGRHVCSKSSRLPTERRHRQIGVARALQPIKTAALASCDHGGQL
jgi:hypothetical protein